jgi:hypothetical protein
MGLPARDTPFGCVISGLRGCLLCLVTVLAGVSAKGLLSDGFIALLFTERYVAGRAKTP